MILSALKKLIPRPVFEFFQPTYHYLIGFLGALTYGFPSKKLAVIGVTGTKGKSTTSYLIAQILEAAGYKTGMATTVLFKIGEKEWLNDTKQTMLGRFQLQKLLKQMVKAGCRYAVIETSSEGILQYRHRFIDYNAAVFTNLTPEHIERHGGFENYRDAKVKLFEKVAGKPNSVGVYNFDDENVSYFLKPEIENKYLYSLKLKKITGAIQNLYRITDVKSTKNGTSFLFNNEKFEIPLIGEFNIYNAAAAICAVLALGVPIEKIKKALLITKAPPGRLEIINPSTRLRAGKGQNFTVIIDYAHEPSSLEAVYKTSLKLKFKNSKLICLLGAQGGGRDKWKRSAMGEIAAKYCDKIILTNEDPYDENPLQIINDIESGFSQIRNPKFETRNLFKIIDRKEAIKKALSLAKKDDVVILTGKGGEVWMCVENGKKIPWDEKQIIEELLYEKI